MELKRKFRQLPWHRSRKSREKKITKVVDDDDNDDDDDDNDESDDNDDDNDDVSFLFSWRDSSSMLRKDQKKYSMTIPVLLCFHRNSSFSQSRNVPVILDRFRQQGSLVFRYGSFPQVKLRILEMAPGLPDQLRSSRNELPVRVPADQDRAVPDRKWD